MTLTCALAVNAATQQTANEKRKFHSPRDRQSAPSFTTAHPLFVKDLRQHNGGAKSNGVVIFVFGGAHARRLSSPPEIHQRGERLKTFITSCENNGLCYIHAFNFLPSPVMPNYCLLLGCAATLNFAVALAAQPAPATKPAIPAHRSKRHPRPYLRRRKRKLRQRLQPRPRNRLSHLIRFTSTGLTSR